MLLNFLTPSFSFTSLFCQLLRLDHVAPSQLHRGCSACCSRRRGRLRQEACQLIARDCSYCLWYRYLEHGHWWNYDCQHLHRHLPLIQYGLGHEQRLLRSFPYWHRRDQRVLQCFPYWHRRYQRILQCFPYWHRCYVLQCFPHRYRRDVLQCFPHRHRRDHRPARLPFGAHHHQIRDRRYWYQDYERVGDSRDCPRRPFLLQCCRDRPCPAVLFLRRLDERCRSNCIRERCAHHSGCPNCIGEWCGHYGCRPDCFGERRCSHHPHCYSSWDRLHHYPGRYARRHWIRHHYPGRDGCLKSRGRGSLTCRSLRRRDRSYWLTADTLNFCSWYLGSTALPQFCYRDTWDRFAFVRYFVTVVMSRWSFLSFLLGLE
ncbi:hypothetical protein OH76DRAFT_633109 [Lentinus brumalis]|uniref:Uncharacterized protein n=1 Tax=Lentinus brumalis TaxID=2498619 RepID=A0A371D8I3_9APHY|nr:hypothetical protein OH76DRAFT_633109 [Polyporus brumalis]